VLKLDEVVVNRIAAGEVIHRPASAIKELLENSLDAGSSSITVVAKAGGLKMLQITDNGCGIKVRESLPSAPRRLVCFRPSSKPRLFLQLEDMGIVCERFTTSKLQAYDDLKAINTFGFRGEALASVSHVSHLTITTMTKDAKCAFKAKYADGKMQPAQAGKPPKATPCAGVKGTTILAEDLFFNVSTRKKALKSPSEEYNKILEVVSRYAIHRAGVSFTCKKHGESAADLHTVVGASKLDNLRSIYSQSLARELVPIELEEDEELKFSMSGYVSNANYNVKKGVLILFINNRLVESSTLKKAIDDAYSPYLPKGTHPFVYLALQMASENIDVNVHPTKKEVRFLHEEQIIEALQRAIEEALVGSNASRTFMTQTLLPQASLLEREGDKDREAGPSKPVIGSTQRDRAPDRKLVRTNDPNPVGQLDTYFISKKRKMDASESGSPSTEPTQTQPKRAYGEERPQVELTSVQNLWNGITKTCHQALKSLFRDAVFVGSADEGFFLAQSGTKLYLMNSHALSRRLIYQEIVRQFAAFPVIELVTPTPVRDILAAAIELPAAGWTPAVGAKEQILTDATELITGRSEMLTEYFSIKIDADGRLCGIPSIIDGYVPDLDGIPMFLLRLATEVNWNEEESCFEGIAMEVAEFCSIQPAVGEGQAVVREEIAEEIQHRIFPWLKKRLLPPHEFASDSTLIQVACLEKLYQIFERC